MNEILEMIQNYAASGKYKRVPVRENSMLMHLHRSAL